GSRGGPSRGRTSTTKSVRNAGKSQPSGAVRPTFGQYFIARVNSIVAHIDDGRVDLPLNSVIRIPVPGVCPRVQDRLSVQSADLVILPLGRLSDRLALRCRRLCPYVRADVHSVLDLGKIIGRVVNLCRI